ncbi:hypothetical protein FKM82_028907 [Ascaphus truei]
MFCSRSPFCVAPVWWVEWWPYSVIGSHVVGARPVDIGTAILCEGQPFFPIIKGFIAAMLKRGTQVAKWASDLAVYQIMTSTPTHATLTMMESAILC